MQVATRILATLFCLWLLVLGVRFTGIVVRGVDSPFNRGADLLWFYTWLAAAALIILAAAAAPRTVNRYVPALALAVGILTLWLSNSFIPAVLALGLTIFCAAMGGAVLRAVLGDAQPWFENAVCGIPIGIGVVGLTIFVLGLSGWLTPVAVSSFLAIATLVTHKSWRRILWACGQTSLRCITAPSFSSETAVLSSLMSFQALAYLTWAVAPEIQYDALNYHLAVPSIYVAHSRILEVQFFHAYLVRLIELFFAVCLMIGGAATAKFWIYLMSIGAVVSVFALGRRLFDPRVGLWAAALFATTPLVGWLAGTAYIDNVLALFVTTSMIAVVGWMDHRDIRWLYITALLAGLAIGSKMNASFAYVIVGPVVVIQLWRRQGMSRGAKVRGLALVTLTGVVVALPMYALMYSYTGNPVFPLFNGIFKSPKWVFDNAIVNSAAFGFGTSLGWLARFPFRFTFDTQRFGEVIPRGAIGMLLLCAFPFSLYLLRSHRAAVRLMIAAVAANLLLLFCTMQYARYYIFVLPLVAVLGVATSFAWPFARVAGFARICLLVIMVVQPLISSVQFWNIPERFPLAVAMGAESRTSFLTRSLNGYACTALVNNQVGPGEHILGVGVESLRYYFDANLETMPLSLLDNPLRAMSALPPGPELAADLSKAGYRWLVIDERGIDPSTAAGFPYAQPEFLAAYAAEQCMDKGVRVYRLRD